MSDLCLLHIQHPVDRVLDMVSTGLEILGEIEAVCVGHMEGVVFRVVEMDVRDGFSLVGGVGDDENIGA